MSFLMKTGHVVHLADARTIGVVQDESVDLIVTSPPYPMIEMWDDIFVSMEPRCRSALDANKGMEAFELMHRQLDRVWDVCVRVLKPGGIACINIGDATRTLGGQFQIYPNHVRISSYLCELGQTPLPDILWRKPTNAPNKFLGSGMLPAAAYVTYEHEYILIFRKGGKRVFRTEDEKTVRRASAFFWEERNIWFSDVWDRLKGTLQKTNGQSERDRSGAYPFELAYRLICMFSVRGDHILDPFLGTGTTTAAAIAACRNSIGVESDPSLAQHIRESVRDSIPVASKRITDRIYAHKRFVNDRLSKEKKFKHQNSVYGFPVVTSQERELSFVFPSRIESGTGLTWTVSYEPAGVFPELNLV